MLKSAISPPCAVGRGRGRVHAAGIPRAERKPPAVGGDELVAPGVVVAQQPMRPAHVAEVQQDVALADGPEVRAAAIVTRQPEDVVFEERMQVLPRRQIVRAEEELRPHPLPAGLVRQRAARDRVVGIALLPDTRVVDEVDRTGRRRGAAHAGQRLVPGGVRPDRARVGDDRGPRDLLPIQQQRIARHGHHVAELVAVIHRDHAIGLHQRRARPAGFLGARRDRVGQVAPVDQVVADHVPPMRPRVGGRKRLVEEVPPPLPEAQPVGVVEPALRAHEVVERPVRVGGQLAPRCREAPQGRVVAEARRLRIRCRLCGRHGPPPIRCSVKLEVIVVILSRRRRICVPQG